VHFTSSDSFAALPADYTFTATDAGTHTFTVTFGSPGTQTVTVADAAAGSIKATSSGVFVTGIVSNFKVTAPASVTAGSSFSFTVTAQDQSGNTITGYGGTVQFSSSDPQATPGAGLPANSTLTLGTKTFSATLKTAGAQTITATDVTTGVNGSASITVNAAAATHFKLVVPATSEKGLAFSALVLARDPYGNTAPSYRGTVALTSSDTAATLPGSYTYTATDAGQHVFGITFNTVNSVSPFTQSLTATDSVTSSITGTASSQVLTGDPHLHATARTLRLFRASPPVIVATFTDDDTAETNSGNHLAANISWGDGTSSAGTVVHIGGLPNLFEVIGSHAYTRKGAFPVKVTITDSQGPSTSATGSAQFLPRNISF
jgi:hypothetical protein